MLGISGRTVKEADGLQREVAGMRWFAEMLLLMYPRAWRIRYADEMRAVLELHRVSVSTIWNLLFHGLHARLFWERRGVWRTQFAVGFAVVSCLTVGSFGTVQQTLRHAANFPQVRMSESISNALATGQSPTGLLPLQTVNVQQSLQPFVIIYNQAGKPILSTVRLHGKTPELPEGVLQYTQVHGRDVLTWQPEPDARIAAVVQHYGDARHGGYVLSGRALRVVEQQESYWQNIFLAMWITLTVAFVVILYFVRRAKRVLRHS